MRLSLETLQTSAALAAVAVSVSLAGCGVNAIPTKEEAAKASWANVQAA